MCEFCKRHKLLSMLFIVSVFLMIKNSSIPYPFNPPPIIQYIFNAPTSEFFSNVAGMVDIFTSAYVTSLLFYIMVDYIPALKQEETAQKIIAPKLVNLYLYMSEIIAMIEYSSKRQGIVIANDYLSLDNLKFENIPIFCKKITYKNESKQDTTPFSYILPKDCIKFRMLILDVCRDISCTSSFSFCDSSVIHIISNIQLSETLLIIGTIEDYELKSEQSISNIEFGNSYKNFLQIHKSLESLIDTKFRYTMIDMSDEETRKWIADSAKILSENPDIAKMLASLEKDK